MITFLALSILFTNKEEADGSKFFFFFFFFTESPVCVCALSKLEIQPSCSIDEHMETTIPQFLM